MRLLCLVRLRLRLRRRLGLRRRLRVIASQVCLRCDSAPGSTLHQTLHQTLHHTLHPSRRRVADSSPPPTRDDLVLAGNRSYA